jgi:hypothetical protein
MQSAVRQRIAGDGPGALVREAVIGLDDDLRIEGRRGILVSLRSMAAAILAREYSETRAAFRKSAVEEWDGRGKMDRTLGLGDGSV